MPVTLAIAQKQTIHLMNANTSGVYNTSITDDRLLAGLVDDAIFGADEDVVLAICECVGHWARADYLTLSSALAHGDELPAHVGDIGQVLIDDAPGTQASLEQILRYRANADNSYGSLAHTAAGSVIGGYYFVSEEDVIYFTGTAAKVRYATYTREATLKSPAIYTSATVAGAVARLLKEGGAIDRAGYYAQMFGGYIQAIQGNQKVLPTLQMANKAA